MIVTEWSPRQCRTGCRFDRDNCDIGSVNFIGNKRERQTGKITATAGTTDDYIRIPFTKHRKLLFGFQADDRLVEHDVIEHTA